MNLKVNQSVLLPCQEVIGTVVTVNKEQNKVVIRAEKNGETFDFIVTCEGYLPHSEVIMIEKIPFLENVTIARFTSKDELELGTISNIHLNKLNGDLSVCGTFHGLYSKKSKIVTLSSCVDINEILDLCKKKQEDNNIIYKNYYFN